MGANSLRKTVTRQSRGCDLNPDPSAPESSTLTTRLPSHPLNCISQQVASAQVASGSIAAVPLRLTLSLSTAAGKHALPPCENVDYIELLAAGKLGHVHCIPQKVPLPVGDPGRLCNTWFLAPTRVHILNGISIRLSIFAGLTPNILCSLQWTESSPPSQKSCPCVGESKRPTKYTLIWPNHPSPHTKAVPRSVQPLL